MNKWIVIIVLSSLNSLSSAHGILSNKIPKYGKTIKSFVPLGWIVLAKTSGDYDGDGIKDCAMVLVDSVMERETADVSRSIIILKGAKHGFRLAGYCDSAVLCLGCGGIHGDPFLSMKFHDDQLIIRHYGGTSWKWELIDKFRFKKGHWLLIGATTNYYHQIEYCEKLKDYEGKDFEDVNYITGEYKKIKIARCSVVINEKGKRTTKPLTELENFNVNRQDSLWNTP